MRIIIYIAGILGLLFLIKLIDRYKYNKKIKSIINSYSDDPSKHNAISSGKSEFKGWSMNNSPFRSRKSGMTWGGGNIKGANASRGSRKSFFK